MLDYNGVDNCGGHFDYRIIYISVYSELVVVVVVVEVEEEVFKAESQQEVLQNRGFVIYTLLSLATSCPYTQQPQPLREAPPRFTTVFSALNPPSYMYFAKLAALFFYW